jgi:hypothetical protein
MRGRGMRRWATAGAVAVVAAASVAACSSGGSVLESSSAAIQPAATPQFVAQSAERTVALETGHVEVVVTAAGGTATITGQFDTAARTFAATVSAQGFDSVLGDVSAEIAVADDVVYVKPDGFGALLGGAADTPWLSLDLGAEGLGGMGGTLPDDLSIPAIDPSELLDELRAEGVAVTEVGTEDVRGVATTHYALVAPAGATEPAWGDLTADVWIDADGLVRRVSLSSGGDDPFTMTAELFDLGAPVSINVPPADQVTDLTTLLGEDGLFGPKPR